MNALPPPGWRTGAVRIEVVEGLQAGARIDLPSGRWRVGRDADSDIVLLDAGVAAHAGTLEVDGPALRWVPNVEGTVGPQTTLAPGSHLRIGPVRLAWEVDAGRLHGELRAASAGLDARRRPMRAATLALSGVLVAGLAAIVGLQSNRAAARADPPAQANARQDAGAVAGLRERLSSFESAELQIDGSPGERLVLSGWVDDEAALRRLRDAVGDGPAQLRVDVVGEQMRFATEYLAALGHEASVSYLGQGRFRVTARGGDEHRLRSDSQRLLAAAPRIRALEVEHRPTARDPESRPEPPPEAAKVPPPTLAGVDGISATGARRYLTLGRHYVFEGGVLRNGVAVRGIEAADIAMPFESVVGRKPERTSP